MTTTTERTPALDPNRERGPMRPLIFHREGMFYPIELPLYDDLSAHAECNPGTLKITDALTGEILWRPQ